MIVVAAQLLALREPRRQSARHSSKMATLVNELEPGCLRYQVGQALDDEDDWLLYEVHCDEAGLDVQRSSAPFQENLIETILPCSNGARHARIGWRSVRDSEASAATCRERRRHDVRQTADRAAV